MFKKILCFVLSFAVLNASLMPIPTAQAEPSQAPSAAWIAALPEPGSMVNVSPAFQPAIIRGMTIHKDNPFLFDFIVEVGQDKLSGEPLKKEGEKLINYFLASLAIPEKDFWVNLSPYEKERTIPQALSQTEMGRDLLAQDYILKQITASLIYPEKGLGKEFWDRVYAKTQQMYGSSVQGSPSGTALLPVNAFNKVWIMADQAEVFERDQTVFVVNSHLKVMLEEDYLALNKNNKGSPNGTTTAQVLRDIILPELEREVNSGKNFANLRQIFNSLILASWYKKTLKEALLNQVYSNQAKIKGIDLKDSNLKQKIYERYLAAYKKGVFNYIKDDPSPSGRRAGPKKYFSGGVIGGKALKPDGAMRATFARKARQWANLGAVWAILTTGMLWSDSLTMADAQTPDAMSERGSPSHPWDRPLTFLAMAGAGVFFLYRGKSPSEVPIPDKNPVMKAEDVPGAVQDYLEFLKGLNPDPEHQITAAAIFELTVDTTDDETVVAVRRRNERPVSPDDLAYLLGHIHNKLLALANKLPEGTEVVQGAEAVKLTISSKDGASALVTPGGIKQFLDSDLNAKNLRGFYSLEVEADGPFILMTASMTPKNATSMPPALLRSEIMASSALLPARFPGLTMRVNNDNKKVLKIVFEQRPQGFKSSGKSLRGVARRLWRAQTRQHLPGSESDGAMAAPIRKLKLDYQKLLLLWNADRVFGQFNKGAADPVPFYLAGATGAKEIKDILKSWGIAIQYKDVSDNQGQESYVRLHRTQQYIVIDGLAKHRLDEFRNTAYVEPLKNFLAPRLLSLLRAANSTPTQGRLSQEQKRRYFEKDRVLLSRTGNEGQFEQLKQGFSELMEVLGSQPNLPMSVGEDAILAETPAKKNVFISMLRGVLHKFEIPQSALMDERAMQAVDGGIDLKYTTAGLSVRRQGSGVQMKIDPAMIERVRQQGIEELAPFIYRVTPVSSILPLVGLDP